MAAGAIDMVINLPMRNKSHSPASFVTQGYLTRRTARPPPRPPTLGKILMGNGRFF